jgi:hypothetical protein
VSEAKNSICLTSFILSGVYIVIKCVISRQSPAGCFVDIQHPLVYVQGLNFLKQIFDRKYEELRKQESN